MDWEKKTAQRDAIKEAAADTFNDMMTPGQSLLTSLQHAEVVRKEHYFSTVGAKMKAAREKLPSLGVKHAVRSDMTIFSAQPASEVHSLLPSVQPKKADMRNVQSMLLSQMERHDEVWRYFVDVRDGCRASLEASVATAAAQLRARLAASSAEMEEDMGVLAEDRVMRLTEPEVHQVWDAVAQRIPERARWLAELGSSLETAEEARRVRVEAALVGVVAGMNEVAALSEGEVERILERESLGLNKEILDNRRAYADLLQRLGVAEVTSERAMRQRWEKALHSWRTLRSLHAMNLFNERIRSPEFSEPAERLQLFDQVREWQSSTCTKVVRHVEGMAALTPPHLGSRRVAVWREDVGRLLEAWLQDIASWESRLRAQDDQLEAAAWAAFAQLTAEVLEYKGYPEDEARALLDKECGEVLRARRTTALELIKHAQRYLMWQASKWQHFLSSLGTWLTKLAELFEEHKASTTGNENGVRATLKARREQYNEEDAQREAALEAAIAAVSQGSSESELDSKVTAALGRLDDIEAGYRTFHTSMVEIVRSFPRTVAEMNDLYHWRLCEMTHIKPQVPQPAQLKEEPAPPPKDALPSEEPAPPPPTAPASAKGKGGKGAKAPSPAPTAPPPEPEPPAPEPPPPPPEPIKTFFLPDGSQFDVLQDLLGTLLQQAATAAAEEEAAAAAAAAPPPPPPEPTPTPPPEPAPPAKKDPKKDAKAAKGKAPAKAATPEPEPEPAAPPPPPPQPAEPPAERSPVSSSGKPHCRECALPEGRFRDVLEQLQVGMLKEMIEFAARTVSTADEWSSDREMSLTEELDAHLRAHRPRAGRIEEETRLSRSVELVAQRRRVESHLRAQSKAVKAQAAQFEEWASGWEAEVAKQIARLRGYEAFLGQCLSCKSIDIRKREAEALRARIEREMAAKLAELKDRVAASCQKITDTNAAFDASELKTFDSGGHYSAENVAAYKRSMAAIDAHASATQQAQVERLEALQGALTQQADEALAHVMGLLPSHHEDMALIEKLDELLDAARKKARTELGKSAEASAAITSELNNLEALLADGHISAQYTNGQLPAGGDVSSGPLPRCQAVLKSLDALRGRLYRQAKALGFIRSTGLAIEPVDLTLDAAGFDPNKQQGAESGAPDAAGGRMGARFAGDAPAAAGGKGGSKPGTPNSARKPGSAGGKAPAAGAAGGAAVDAASEVVTLAVDIEEVIDACKRDTVASAQAYYTALFPEPVKGAKGAKAAPAKKPVTPPAKGGKPATPSKAPVVDEGPQPVRPIRYPQRIPISVDVLQKQTDAVLEALRDQLREHVAAGVKELRTQVIRAYRLAEHAPSVAMALLTQHELQAARASCDAVDGKYQGRQKKLLAQIDRLRRALHPSMIQPSRRQELLQLKDLEISRAAGFKAVLSEFASEAVKGVEAQGPVIRRRLIKLVCILLKLLDNFLMPDDLPPISSDGTDDWVYALPGRKDDQQLHRLALANAEAEGIPAAEPAGGKADAKGGKDAKKEPPKKPPSAKGDPKKPGTPGSAAGDVDTAQPRPFGLLTWALPAGNFDLDSLGWTNDESSGLPHITPDPALAEPDPALAAPAPVPSTPPKGAAKPPAGGKVTPRGGAAAEPALPPGAAMLVTGMDTPCHRAGIRAYRASLQQCEEALKANLQALRSEMQTWSKDDRLWTNTWHQLVSQVEGL